MTTPSRTAIIAGNWKMHFGPKQAASFAREIIAPIGQLLEHFPRVISVLCPPAISLPAVHEALHKESFQRVELGAQNMFYENKGAFTGEISPSMVRELCSYVILGHSERRMYFFETDELVNKKVHAALRHELRPIVCVGELLAQYEAGQTEALIRTQVQQSLGNLPTEHINAVVIAYEPIWAIGTGKSATAEDAEKAIHFIRELFADMYGSAAANGCPILYGGSVTPANIVEFTSVPDIDGALVGGASLKPDFVEIVRKTIEVMQAQQ